MNLPVVILAVFLLVTLFFILACIKKDNTLVDVAWGLGFVVIAAVVFGTTPSVVQVLVTILVALWGLRLAWYVIIRSQGKPEDSRYAAFRKKWKHFYLESYLKIYLLQGSLMLIIAAPIIALGNASPLVHWTTGLFFVTWCIGYYFEVVADYQLYKFKKNPKNKGKLLTTGLRKYSRYPSYFGEIVMWWSIYFLSQQWWMFFGPLLLTWALFKFSGIPLLEEKRMKRKDYKKYAKKTSLLIPLPARD